MKIGIVCPYAWDRVGGVQTHVRYLARSLRARDHDVSILTPTTGERSAEDGVTYVGRAVGVPANGSVAPVSFGPLAASGVRRALAGLRLDVIHLHEPLIPSISLLALWNANAPTVGTFHAAAESSFGYRVSRPALERTARRLTVKTAVSDAARSLISRYVPGEYLLTPNGVDVKRFATAEPADLGLGKKILFLGRLERRKGLEVLIQAMTRLRDMGARLVVVGAGPEERAARSLASSLGVDADFLGRVHDDDLPSIYRGADVYCAPGLGGESFGIVLIEAMAAGTPVVCSDLDGFRAVAGGAAELVPPGEAGPLADALRLILSEEETAARMSKASSRLAASFDWSRLVAGVESVYERALEA